MKTRSKYLPKGHKQINYSVTVLNQIRKETAEQQ